MINSQGNVIYFPGFVDDLGNPVKKTKFEYPYSYDGFVTYRNGKNEEVTHTVYSDRLLQQEYQKTRDLMKKYFKNPGDSYTDRKPKAIEKFLAEWFDAKKVKLIYMMEHCNTGSGYPLWSFHFQMVK